MADLTGKVVIVTGAATGVGRATAETLARHGAAVVVAGHSLDGAEEVVTGINAHGGRAVAAGVDVADESQVKALVDLAVSRFGGLDALHNNAAATRLLAEDADVVAVSSDVWTQTMAVNVNGPFFGCKYAIPEMIKRGGGTIVNTSSTAGLLSERTRAAYGASKAALHGLTRNVANSHGKQNIRCNAIALGKIVIDSTTRSWDPSTLDVLQEANALARLGRPADVAELVAFLCSDEASFITGQIIAIDGGKTSHLP